MLTVTAVFEKYRCRMFTSFQKNLLRIEKLVMQTSNLENTNILADLLPTGSQENPLSSVSGTLIGTRHY